MSSIYDRLMGKKFDTIKQAIGELAKYFVNVLVVSQDDESAVLEVIGSFEQRQAFEPKFVWNPVIPRGETDPKARVHWSTVVGVHRDRQSKRPKYIL